MQSRIIIALLLSFISISGFSQINYHRVYETNIGTDTTLLVDTVFYHMSSATVSGDVTAFGTSRLEGDNLSLVFTNHDEKGNINWSQEINLGQDTVTILDNGEIDINEAKDSILFTIDVEINGTAKQLFGKMTTDGSEYVIKTIGGNEFATLGNLPKVTHFFNQTDLLVTQGDRPTISRIGEGEDLLWSRSYQFLDDDNNEVQDAIADIKLTQDSSFVILGNHVNGTDIIVSEMDSNGVQIWAESYTFSQLPGAIGSISPNEIFPLESGNFAIVGDADLDFGGIKYGFVVVVDTAGVTQFSKIVTANSNFTTEIFGSIRNVVQAPDNSLWLSGVYTEMDTTRYFMTNIDESGNQNWTTRYGMNIVTDEEFTTSMFANDDNGFVTLIGQGVLGENTVLSVMRHNTTGATRCSDTMMVMMQDVILVEDTLTTEVVNGGLFFVDFEAEKKVFNGFTPPVLNVDGNYMFCPNEPIDTILIASVSGVEDVTYEWSTGETNDTIRVFMDGQFSVTATIGEDVCYTMCDTIELTRFAVPQVGIQTNDQSRCEDGQVIMDVILSANVQEGKQPFTYLWSTDEVTGSINISEPGTYSVTVVDDCGFTAEATEDIIVQINASEASIDQEVICDEENNALSNVIFSANGTEGAELNLQTKEFPDTGTSPVSLSNPTGQLPLGTYHVEVRNFCGEILDSITVNTSLACGGFLQYPKIFFPAGNDDSEKVFRPIPSDTMDITRISDVEFKVFNRWGETVYETSSTDSQAVLQAWDGTHKGAPAPSEVYIWYVSYILDAGTDSEAAMLDEGDITLVR